MPAARCELSAGGSESSFMRIVGPLRLFGQVPTGIDCSRFRRSAISGALRLRTIILFVSANDLLDEIMANHVFFVELGDTDAIDFAADFECFNQTGFLARRKIDLRDVASDHGLGVEPEPGQE